MATEENLYRVTRFHSSLLRPVLFLGGEREITLVIGMLAVGLIIMTMQWVTFFMGIILWVGSIPFLRMMAKSDPFMSKVFNRYIRYKKYYAPTATAFRKH